MKTYLVTGGAGFIGSNYIHYMFNKYSDIFIINVDKLTYAGDLKNLEGVVDNPNYRFIKADICDEELMKNIFDEYDIDRVVHFAAESHVDRSIQNASAFVKTNVLGTQVLLNVAKNNWEKEDGTYKDGKKFLYVSTDEVYGSLGEDGYFTEDSPYNPRNPYAASKAAGDLLVKSYIHTFKFPANITHCGNNYGPRQNEEKFIPMIFSKINNNESIPVYGDGKNVRDWIYVEDHVAALDFILEKGQLYEVYNIGANCEKENLEVIEEIGKNVPDANVEKLIQFVADRKGHDRRYALDTTKINRLGWRPAVEFQEGIEKTVIYYEELLSLYSFER